MNCPKRIHFSKTVPIFGVLLAVLLVAGVLVPAFEKTGQMNPSDRARQDLDKLSNAFLRFQQDLNDWPYVGESKRALNAMQSAFLGGYPCLFERRTKASSWRGPYLTPEALVDPWGGGYQVYHFPPTSILGLECERIVLFTTGPNRTIDTSSEGLAFGYPSGDDLLRVIER